MKINVEELQELQTRVAYLEQQNAELRSELDLAALVFESSVAMLVTDANSRILHVNKGYAKLTGFSADEMRGKLPSVFNANLHDETFFQHLRESIKVNGFWQGEIWDKNKDGTIYPQWLNITAIHDRFGVVGHYVASFSDISEKKKIEQQLALAREEAEMASRAKSNFLATISHEIRTPINLIIGASYLLARSELTQIQRQDIQSIEVSSKSLLSLINNILDFSKIETEELALDFQAFSLQNLLHDLRIMFNPLATERGLDLSITSLDNLPLPLLNGDFNRLNQCLINLLSNAFKFTANGEIRLTVNECSRDEGKSTISLRFTIVDTGIGIAKDVQARLFKPFTQADEKTTRLYGGSGLGLSIVKRFADLLGGSVGVDSEVGQGATFWLELPFEIARTNESSVTQPLPISQASGKNITDGYCLDGCHIMLVDDSITILKAQGRILERTGARVTLCASGEEVIRYFSQEAVQTVDVILMDMQMPILDGCETTLRLRKDLHLDVPIIAFTAGATTEEKVRAQKAGMVDFLIKPVDVMKLSSTLWSHIAQNRKAIVKSTPPVKNALHQADDLKQQTGWPVISGFNMTQACYLLDGDLEFFKALLEPFLTEHAGTVDDVRNLIGAGNLQQAAKRVHNLRGQAANLGAMDIQETAGALEESLHNTTLDIDTKFNDFAQANLRVFTAARGWLKNYN